MKIKTMILQLPLIRQWFEMTEAGIKTEDYRSITPYWCARFLLVNGQKKSKKAWEYYQERHGKDSLILICKASIDGCVSFIPFTTNIMTLGYPSKNDESRILRYEHSGIEIRTGNPDWGAEPEKLYFVIKHGKIIK